MPVTISECPGTRISHVRTGHYEHWNFNSQEPSNSMGIISIITTLAKMETARMEVGTFGKEIDGHAHLGTWYQKVPAYRYLDLM